MEVAREEQRMCVTVRRDGTDREFPLAEARFSVIFLFYFFYLVCIYSPRGLGPMIDSNYLYNFIYRPGALSFTPKRPSAFYRARPERSLPIEPGEKL